MPEEDARVLASGLDDPEERSARPDGFAQVAKQAGLELGGH